MSTTDTMESTQHTATPKETKKPVDSDSTKKGEGDEAATSPRKKTSGSENMGAPQQLTKAQKKRLERQRKKDLKEKEKREKAEAKRLKKLAKKNKNNPPIEGSIANATTRTRRRRGFFGRRKKEVEEEGGAPARRSIRNSFAFFGRGSFSSNKVASQVGGRSTVAASLMVVEDEDLLPDQSELVDSRVDSIDLRRKAHQSLTKSLQLDMDIFNYLREREPSVTDDFETRDSVDAGLPLTKKQKRDLKRRQKREEKLRKKKEKYERDNGRDSDLLLETGVTGAPRAPTMTASLELNRREELAKEQKRGRGVFSSIFIRPFSFLLPRRSKRERFRSYKETNVDDMKMLLDKDEKLFRPDSEDEDEDLGSDLLVKSGGKSKPELSEDEMRARKSSRVSTVFDTEALEKEDKKQAEKAITENIKNNSETDSSDVEVERRELTSSVEREANNVLKPTDDVENPKDEFLDSPLSKSSKSLPRVDGGLKEKDEESNGLERTSTSEFKVVNTGRLSQKKKSLEPPTSPKDIPPPMPPLPPKDTVNLALPDSFKYKLSPKMNKEKEIETDLLKLDD